MGISDPGKLICFYGTNEVAQGDFIFLIEYLIYVILCLVLSMLLEFLVVFV